MGVGNYFMAKKPKPASDPEQPPPPPEDAREGRRNSSSSEKTAMAASSQTGPSGERPTGGPFQTPNGSRPGSSSGRSATSVGGGGSALLGGIKHEVMVNHLYQQQCSNLWVSPESSDSEGVLLRKARGQYMACPPEVGSSYFAIACAALNVQVRCHSSRHVRCGDELR